MKESFQTIIYIIIFLSIFIFRFFVFDGIIIAQSTVGCSLNNPIVIINPEKNYGLPLQNVSYLVTVINRDNPLSCQVPIIYKIEVKECPYYNWICNVKDVYLIVNVGSQNSTYLFVKSNSSYIPQDFTITLNVSNKTGNNFVNTINSTIYKISDIIFNEADDYSGKYRGIALYGDLNYLNSFLNVYYENNPISNVIFNCTFSSKTCYSSGNVNTTIACTINNPSYNFCNLNRIYCTLLNPINNSYILTTFSRDFIPINFSLESINNIPMTVGESRKIPFKLISNSLLKSKYYINVSTTQPNAITLSNNNFSIELGYGYFESTYSLFLTQTPSANPCLSCIYINAISEIGSCSKPPFPQTLSSYLISLNDFDLFAVIEIILISILIFAAIIFKK